MFIQRRRDRQLVQQMPAAGGADDDIELDPAGLVGHRRLQAVACAHPPLLWPIEDAAQRAEALGQRPDPRLRVRAERAVAGVALGVEVVGDGEEWLA